MKNLFVVAIFLITSFKVFAQFDYQIFQEFSNPIIKQQNSKLISVTELQLADRNNWLKISYQEFNPDGLPNKLIQYDKANIEIRQMHFYYSDEGEISRIETYEGKKHNGSTEFKLNASGQVVLYTEYIYSSLDSKKLLVGKTFIEYYPDKTIKKTINIETDADTSKVNYYSTSGELVKSIWKIQGLRTTKIEYLWNKDKTEMKENHYENDTSIYSTVIHRYRNKKEVERIDPSISMKPFYWKYDSNGRVIETNQDYYDVIYYSYDNEGRLVNKIMNILFTDSSEKDLPKKVSYKYEYKLRN